MNGINVKSAKQITFLALIFLLSSSILSAQDCGPVIGEKSGRVIETGKCNSDGQRYGEWTFYYDNNLKDEIRLKAKGNYANGKKHGVWQYFDDRGPYILQEATYQFGILSGPYKDYYDTGNKNRWIKSKGEYASGKREGQWIDYWDNGCYGLEGPPKEIAIYKEGIRHGESMTFYDSNCYPKEAMASRGFYDNGQKDGEWKYYNDEGNEDEHLIKKFNFNKGAMNGRHYLYENGRVSKSFDYTTEPGDEGVPEFNEAGVLVKKVYPDYYLTFYKDSGNTPILESKIPLDKEGKKIGTWLFYYKSGKLEQERTLETTTQYYESGKLHYSVPHSIKYRNINGVKKEYEENGVLKAMYLYSYGDLRYEILLHPNGKIKKASAGNNYEYWELYDDGSLKKYHKYKMRKLNRRDIDKKYKKGKKSVSNPPEWEVEMLDGLEESWAKIVSDYFKQVNEYVNKK